jgi:hypothetical protein
LEHLPVEVDAAGVILVDLSQQSEKSRTDEYPKCQKQQHGRKILHHAASDCRHSTASDSHCGGWAVSGMMIMQLLIAVTAPRQTVTVAAGQSQAGALL